MSARFDVTKKYAAAYVGASTKEKTAILDQVVEVIGKRVYDTPKTPYKRLLEAGVLSRAHQAELTEYKAGVKPLEMARRITTIQLNLDRLAAKKTARLEQQLRPKLPPKPGIRATAS